MMSMYTREPTKHIGIWVMGHAEVNFRGTDDDIKLSKHYLA